MISILWKFHQNLTDRQTPQESITSKQPFVRMNLYYILIFPTIRSKFTDALDRCLPQMYQDRVGSCKSTEETEKLHLPLFSSVSAAAVMDVSWLVCTERNTEPCELSLQHFSVIAFFMWNWPVSHFFFGCWTLKRGPRRHSLAFTPVWNKQSFETFVQSLDFKKSPDMLMSVKATVHVQQRQKFPRGLIIDVSDFWEIVNVWILDSLQAEACECHIFPCYLHIIRYEF